MNKKDLLKLAKQHYISNASLSKVELIRNIQLAEGNFDCFATSDNGECDQALCCWRKDCLPDSNSSEIRQGRVSSIFCDQPPNPPAAD